MPSHTRKSPTPTGTPTPSPSGTTPSAPPVLKRSTLLALCACVLVAQSMVAAINLLIPQLAASDLHPSRAEILWTVDAYVIAFAGLLIPAGALGDRYGRRVPFSPGSGCSPWGPGSVRARRCPRC